MGFILIDRKLSEHWLWNTEKFDKAHAWLDLILLANYVDKKKFYKGEIITCKRGDVNLSVKELASRWGWNWRTAKNFLNALANDGMITAEYTTKRTTITLINYDKYQFDATGVHNEMQNTVHNEVQNRVHITKEIKEVKEKEIKNIYGTYQHVRLTKDQFDKLVSDYGEQETLDAVTFLDEYIEMKGYKAKNHNLALRKWVFDAVKEEKRRKNGQPQPKKNANAGMQTHSYDFAALEEEAFGGKP